jgi:hypothetical protein
MKTEKHIFNKKITMTFKAFTLRLLILFSLTGCNQKLDKQTVGQPGIILLADKEVFTLYKKLDTVVHVIRALETNNDTIDLHLYEVNTSIAEGAKQRFVSVERLTRQQLDSIKNTLRRNYTWKPIRGNEILFVQIQPTGFKDEMQLLSNRQEIETITSKALQDNKLGEWFAGDLGPGGGNILYQVSNIDKSIQIILNVLQKNGVEKNVIIGRRVLIDKDDWFYEVIYPTKYTGDFNTM